MTTVSHCTLPFRGGAYEGHEPGSMPLKSTIRAGAPNEPGSMLAPIVQVPPYAFRLVMFSASMDTFWNNYVTYVEGSQLTFERCRQPLSKVFVQCTTSCRFEPICRLPGGDARVEMYVSIFNIRCNRMRKMLPTFPSSAQLLHMSVFVSTAQCVWVLGGAHRLLTGFGKPFFPRSDGLLFNNERSTTPTRCTHIVVDDTTWCHWYNS